MRTRSARWLRFVSLVAFDFLETRVLGILWPGFVRFPEINLRFYIRCGERRGVCFIRELVPSRLVAWLARTLYDEPYVHALAHPRWTIHPVQRFTVDVDFGLIYSTPWAVLQRARPHSVVLATGSPITVSKSLVV